MQVYLDNAASTPLDKQVFESMMPYFLDKYGNPSSIHTHGREMRNAIEKSRKTIADLLNCSPSEIFFTSGGTEADNIAINGAINSFDIKHSITSPIEHHAVLNSLEFVKKRNQVNIHLLDVDNKGEINLLQLEQLLRDKPFSFVSIMHANNEIGNVYPIDKIALMCNEYKAVFHSDTVQTMGHFIHDLEALNIDFIVGSAHKFHGPKGVGFIYINGNRKIHSLIQGGSQERNMRAGTENVSGIVGMSKALELAYSKMQNHKSHIVELKSYMIEKLKENFEDVQFNGHSELLNDNALYTVLSVSFPSTKKNEMFLFNLDISGISCSGGSACTSGAQSGSHVLEAIGSNSERPSVRFSFSKENTKHEIDFTISVIKKMYD